MEKKNSWFQFLLRYLLSVLLALAFSTTLAIYFFDINEHDAINQLFLIVVPAVAFAWLFSEFYIRLKNIFHNSTPRVWGSIGTSTFIVASIYNFAIPSESIIDKLAVFICSWFLAFIFSLPTLNSLENAVLENKKNLLIGWLAGVIVAFFLVSVFSEFYLEGYEFFLLIFIFTLTSGLISKHLVGKIKHIREELLSSRWVDMLVFISLLSFVVAIVRDGLQFLRLTDKNIFLLGTDQIITFFAIALFSAPWLIFIDDFVKENGYFRSFRETSAYKFIQDNLIGLLISLLFFVAYFILSSALNQPHFGSDDTFFDADAVAWRVRLTTPAVEDPYWRAVHPLALLLFRPAINIIATFFAGNTLYAASALLSLAGTSCVFLIWIFVKKATNNKTYALLMSVLLGITSTNLIFSALIETYIFSALTLILFFVILQHEKWSLSVLVPIGIAAFGITVTNIAQTVIGLFVTRPNFKLVIRYIILVLTFGIVLSQVHNIVYADPNPLFFLPDRVGFENRHINKITSRRVEVVAREAIFYNIVAPEPIVFTEGLPTPKYWFYKRIIVLKQPMRDMISEYENVIGTVTAWFWLLLLLLSGILFLRNLFSKSSTNKLSVALLLSIAFNLALHLTYGKEIFLYSSGWTYAMILFMALAWQELAKHKWFQTLLMVFLFLLMINNSQFIATLLNTTAPFVQRVQ
ncbi:MAG: hypothetical protein ISR59_05595 [Anaerolineales bacterium]|nr:hypothetical protein [Anaerolineales bacterium]